MTEFGSGIISYATISGTIEVLVSRESRRSLIPGMDQDDLAQEIRLVCLRVLDRFDPTRIGPSPYSFLRRCVHNYLYNMKRGVWVPNNPPCNRCSLWDKKNKICKVNEENCEDIKRYRRSMALKASIKRPGSLEYDVTDKSESTSKADLEAAIKDKLPAHLKKSYELLISGRGREISHSHKKQIRRLVKDLISDA